MSRIMTQALECHGLPQRTARVTERMARGTGWLGWLRSRLFGSGDRRDVVALRHCSEHILRDIGLLDDRRGNRLLRDDVLLRR